MGRRRVRSIRASVSRSMYWLRAEAPPQRSAVPAMNTRNARESKLARPPTAKPTAAVTRTSDVIRGFASSAKSAARDGAATASAPETGIYFHPAAFPENAGRIGTTLSCRRSRASAPIESATRRAEQERARRDVRRRHRARTCPVSTVIAPRRDLDGDENAEATAPPSAGPAGPSGTPGPRRSRRRRRRRARRRGARTRSRPERSRAAARCGPARAGSRGSRGRPSCGA